MSKVRPTRQNVEEERKGKDERGKERQKDRNKIENLQTDKSG